MIDRIEHHRPIEFLESCPRKPPPCPIQYGSTIRFGKKKKQPTFEWVKSILKQIWEFLKYNVLFCFFDAQEEKEKRQADDLKEFMDDYCSASERLEISDLKKEKEEIKELYENLNREIKQIIKESFDEVIKEIRPNISKKKLATAWKKTVENPFILFEPKESDQVSYQPFMKALLIAHHKLSGYA